jgi:hypothetical protein
MSGLIPSNGILFTLPYTQPLSVDGKPMPYCYRVFYETNSTTALNVYSDAGLTGLIGNIVVADAYGQFQPIFLIPGCQYRCQLFNAANQLLEDSDPINGPAMGTPFTAGVVRSAVKTQSTARTLASGMEADPDLQVYVPNAGTYKIDLDICFTASAAGATPGAIIALNSNIGTINNFATLAFAGTSNSLVAAGAIEVGSNYTLALGTTALSNTIRLSGTLQFFAPTAANKTEYVYFSWGVAGASGTTTLLAGSSLTVTQVA